MADALTLMKGNADGHGKGLTTYPGSDDPEFGQARHEECLALEKDGKIRRYVDLEAATEGTRHVIWMPVDPQ